MDLCFFWRALSARPSICAYEYQRSLMAFVCVWGRGVRKESLELFLVAYDEGSVLKMFDYSRRQTAEEREQERQAATKYFLSMQLQQSSTSGPPPPPPPSALAAAGSTTTSSPSSSPSAAPAAALNPSMHEVNHHPPPSLHLQNMEDALQTKVLCQNVELHRFSLHIPHLIIHFLEFWQGN